MERQSFAPGINPDHEKTSVNEPVYAYTAQVLAKHWGDSEATIRRLVQTGQLCGIRVGRQLCTRPDHVREYQERPLGR
jgi:hypothetical protein